MGSMEARGTVPENSQAQKQIPAAGRKGSRKRSITIFAIVSLLNVGLLVFLWTQLLTPAQNAAQGRSQAGFNDPLVGHPAPNFTLGVLSLHSAAPISLINFKGKPVVLNVWNSTCVPCVSEAALLQSQWQRVQSKGVVFIGIDFQDTKSDGLSFLQKYGITYPNVLDMSGSTAISYGVTGTPETLFIDRQGVVVSRVSSELTEQMLQSNLQLITR
jgi:cytochrome c biogenesis protein CcmG, thiol:disulfide interchange protein DsbE